MSHVFVSYIKENHDKAKKLSDALRKHGIDVWLDRDSIFPGMRWKDAIKKAINDGTYFIACFSVEYENREKSYMNEELMLAVDELRQYSPDRPWFIPVLFSECNVPALSVGGGQTLLDFQWVNLYSDWGLGIQKLLRVINADQINEIKKLIDEFGYAYTRRVSDHIIAPETPKEFYLKKVRELKENYGLLYDPIKLYLS